MFFEKVRKSEIKWDKQQKTIAVENKNNKTAIVFLDIK